MRTPYEDYVRLYLSMDYSKDESEFYASIILETDEEVQSMVQSMVQNVSDEEDNTWGHWTPQGKRQPPTACLRRAESDSQKNSNRIARRMRVLLNNGYYKCISQARCQAESMIVSKKCAKKSELDKIKEECKDQCCNPAGSSASATISEAATEHDNEPLLVKAAKALLAKATCQEAKRPRKSGKGTESKRPKKSGKGTGFHTRKTSSDSATSSDTETLVPTVLPSDDELPVPTVLPSDDDGG